MDDKCDVPTCQGDSFIHVGVSDVTEPFDLCKPHLKQLTMKLLGESKLPQHLHAFLEGVDLGLSWDKDEDLDKDEAWSTSRVATALKKVGLVRLDGTLKA